MSVPRTIERVNDLMALMRALEGLYGELAKLLEQKSGAMRRADIDRLTALGAKEVELTQRLRERDAVRRPLLEAVGRELGLAAPKSKSLTVTQLCGYLDDPQRSRLMECAKALRAAVFRTGRINRIAGAVAREVLEHMRWVFASVQPRSSGGSRYGDMNVGPRILDAVG